MTIHPFQFCFGDTEQFDSYNIRHWSRWMTNPPRASVSSTYCISTHRPPETFVNLLLLYCKYSYFDLAADILAENADLIYKNMNPQEYEFLDALIQAQSTPEVAYCRFDELTAKHIAGRGVRRHHQLLRRGAQVGKNISTTINPLETQDNAPPKRTVAMEARLPKELFLKMRD